MSKYLSLFINSSVSILLFKEFYSFIFNSSQQTNKFNFIMSKITKLEQEIKEIHLIVDTLEQNVSTLEQNVSTLEQNVSTLEQKVSILELNFTNKMDNFLTSNYDIVNLSINTH